MATDRPIRLNELPENFLRCPVCSELFQIPKLLSCLHRYCRDCLDTAINESEDGLIECQVCKQKSTIPANGVDGFKVDIHITHLVELKKLHIEFENTNTKKCVDCGNESPFTAHCFRCNDFLCDQCYKTHITSIMFSDHKRQILKKGNENNVTLEELTDMEEGRKCPTHQNREAHSCCKSCKNAPVCGKCTSSKHNEHDVHLALKLAKTEVDMLEKRLDKVNQHRAKLYELPEKIRATQSQLRENVTFKSEQLINQHKEQVGNINEKVEERKSVREQGLKNIETRRKYEESQTEENFKRAMKQLEEKFNEERKTIKEMYDNESQTFKKRCDRIDWKLMNKYGMVDENLTDLQSEKDRQAKQNEERLKELADYCDQIIKRFENVSVTASSIVACNDEWTSIQCIPDVISACEPLTKEMASEFEELEPLSIISVNDITNVIVEEVSITECESSEVDIDGIAPNGWWIDGIANIKDGDLVVTGSISDECSHITVINTQGRIKRQDLVKATKKYDRCPYRYCCSLSDSKVATIYQPDEIGIYDARNGSYKKKNISEEINIALRDQHASCVATCPENNDIIVGTSSRDVYVFDHQLKYRHVMTLPDVVKGSTDITVHNGNLLVCDGTSKMTYAVSIERPKSRLVYEFTKPVIAEGDAGPIRVCTDSNDFIYMLWRTDKSHHILVQYSQDGRRRLKTIQVNDDAWTCITMSDKNNGTEKLLIATFKTGKLFTFGLAT